VPGIKARPVIPANAITRINDFIALSYDCVAGQMSCRRQTGGFSIFLTIIAKIKTVGARFVMAIRQPAKKQNKEAR